MTLFSPTLASVEQEVYVRLGGMPQVQENVGRSVVQAAINAAQLQVLADLPHAFVAGSCLSVQDIPGANGSHPLPPGVVAVLGVQCPGGISVRYGSLDAILRFPSQAPPGVSQEVGYYPTATAILVRPYQASITAYLAMAPTVMSTDNDPVSLSPVAFGALCSRAALTVAGQWRDFPADRLALMENQYKSAVATILSILGSQAQKEG